MYRWIDGWFDRFRFEILIADVDVSYDRSIYIVFPSNEIKGSKARKEVGRRSEEKDGRERERKRSET